MNDLEKAIHEYKATKTETVSHGVLPISNSVPLIAKTPQIYIYIYIQKILEFQRFHS